jgi:hypothetical protein
MIYNMKKVSPNKTSCVFAHFFLSLPRMNHCCLRLKIDFHFTNSNQLDNKQNGSFKFMHFLDIEKTRTFTQLKRHICQRISEQSSEKVRYHSTIPYVASPGFNSDHIQLYIDDFEVPAFEPITLLRDMDNIK